MSKQDAFIRNDPYTAEFISATDEADNYSVLSSSDPATRYRTSLHRGYPDDDRCSCPARVPCNHIERARLRRLIDRQTRASECHYALWQMAELVDEDERLRAVLAEADSWLVRCQWSVVGDRIGELLQRQAAA